LIIEHSYATIKNRLIDKLEKTIVTLPGVAILKIIYDACFSH